MKHAARCAIWQTKHLKSENRKALPFVIVEQGKVFCDKWLKYQFSDEKKNCQITWEWMQLHNEYRTGIQGGPERMQQLW